jgi:hypothetical protein
MIQFAKVYPDEKIVVLLIRQLSWTHFLEFICLLYLTELSPRKLLEKKLHEAIGMAREQITAQQIENKKGK